MKSLAGKTPKARASSINALRAKLRLNPAQQSSSKGKRFLLLLEAIRLR
jgi:hypothetical protein